MSDSRRRKVWRRRWSGFGLSGLFSRKACGVLIFIIGLVLFIYPFLNIDLTWTPQGLYLYLYVSWGGIIFLLAVIGKNLPPLIHDDPRES